MAKVRRKNKSIDVKSIEGLQDLLHDTAVDHRNIPERDLQHVRVGVSTINTGKSLIRTKIEVEKWDAKKASVDITE